MQKKYLKRTILLFLLAGIIFACVYDDDSGQFSKESFMEEAQKWYDGNRGNPIDAQFVEESPEVLIKPEWKYPYVQRKEEYATLEVPILSDRYFGFIDPECMKKYEETKDYRYILSETHLVIRKNLATNEMDGFLMTTSPSLEYLESTGFNPFKDICYLFRDEKFSGFIIYHDLNGNFANGWQYKDGEAYSIFPTKNPQETELKSSQCDIVYEVLLITECQSQYAEMGGYMSDIMTSCTQYLEYNYLYQTCYDIGDGNYPHGGGGSSGSTPATYAPKASKIFRNSNMTKENWEKLEKMINKIIENCMGSALYNGLSTYLNGKTLTFQYVGGNISSFHYDGVSAGISLKMDATSYNLFHEMFHAYQAYQETHASYLASQMNTEIETRYAQYLYVRELDEYKDGSKWMKRYTDTNVGKTIAKLERYIDNKGTLQSGVSNEELDLYVTNNAAGALKELGYTNYQYDYQKAGTQNFNNLKKLTKNCE